MASNSTVGPREAFEYFCSTGKFRRGEIFSVAPRALPHTAGTWEKVHGMLIGVAVGDALGAPSETMLPEERQSVYGQVRDYVQENPRRPVLPLQGKATDDTQTTFWTIDQMTKDGGFVPYNVADRLARPQTGGGSTTAGFIRNFRALAPPDIALGEWMKCGIDAASNGSLMRITPVLLPHIKASICGAAVHQVSEATSSTSTTASGTGAEHMVTNPWMDAVVLSAVSHNNSMGIASCVAFSFMLWELLCMSAPPPPMWYLDTFVSIAKQLETEKFAPRNLPSQETKYFLWEFCDTRLRHAYTTNMSVLEGCTSWHSGAFLMETVPCVLYILMKHGDNAEEAIIRAVNDTKDNDTIASIVGGCVGALHGIQGIPNRWIEGHSGRLLPTDPNRLIFQILEQAKSTFWVDP
ncbi:ADP-ribosylglycohydrolase [Pelomyxa schiedti]|nr:ADP-ribosylglycohydrolase [Pelomyxa schiedti]